MNKVTTRFKDIENIIGLGKGVLPTSYYSEEEMIVGQWIDKRPIYRIVKTITSLSGATTTISVSDLNIDQLTNIYMINRGNPSQKPHPSFVVTNYAPSNYYVFLENSKISINVSTDAYFRSFPIYVIMEYVKTLDSPVDIAPILFNYSNTEQVIGRWIDGRLVYRVTEETKAPSVGDTWQKLNLSHFDSIVDTVDNVIDIKGFIDYYQQSSLIFSTGAYSASRGNNLCSTIFVKPNSDSTLASGINCTILNNYINYPMYVTLEYIKKPSVDTLDTIYGFNINNI